MCFSGGGGGGGSSEVIDREREEEAARLAEIEKTKAAINTLFDDPRRAVQYDEAAEGVTALNRADLDRQREEEARGLRFGLARSGLAGGSADVDIHGRLEDQYGRGVARAAELGSDVASGIREGDERTRGDLIRQAEGGLSQDAAVNRALAGMSATAESNLGRNRVASLGSAFSNVADSLITDSTRRGEQRAIDDFRRRSEATTASLAPGKGSTGRVTSIG